MRSIRVFAKNMDDPYYEPTIVVHDTYTKLILNVLLHTHFTKKTMNQCIVQPVCRLSWAKCFVTSGAESAKIEL